MTTMVGGLPATGEEVVPGISVRTVPFDQPWEWLAAGWRDLWTHPATSLSYGAAFAVIAALLAWGTTMTGAQSIVLALFGGFLLIGPLIAAWLYDISRRIEADQPVSLGRALKSIVRPKGQLGFMGIALFLIFVVWMQIAFLLFMLFAGGRGFPPPEQFVHMLFFTSHGLGLLVVGTLAGAILAFITFAVSAVSVPLLMVRDIDVVTAMRTSVRAVVANPKAMVLWAALISGFVVLGILTMCAGLVVMFPLVGHATWHAFKDLVILDDEAVEG